MTLRQQSSGKQGPWSLEELRAGFERFFEEHSHYPTATEVDKYAYLPSARSIERTHGGLVSLRKQLGIEGQLDLRSGQHRTDIANMILERAHKSENIVYDFLCELFSKELVHREYFFTDDARTRADFFVYDAQGGFCVDVFYPANRRNLTGCLNIKLKKYLPDHMRQYPVIFLEMNPEISDEDIKDLLSRKIQKIGKDQDVMTWNSFQEYCRTRKPLRVGRQ